MFTQVELSSLVRRTSLPGPLSEFTSGLQNHQHHCTVSILLDSEFNNDNIIKDPTSETEYAMTDGKSLFLIKLKVQWFRRR